MKKPAIPPQENERIRALNSYSILDSMAEKEYDDITYIAAQICGTPISLISLIDEKRQWFKSHHGIEATETPREIAFCAHAINEKDNPFIVCDSRIDERFSDNPLVTTDPYVIFYAGIPLVTPDGYPLGTLCVIDKTPHQLTDLQVDSLKALARQVMSIFAVRKKNNQLNTKLRELKLQNKALEKFASVAAHDLKSPLHSISQLSEMLADAYQDTPNTKVNKYIELIQNSSVQLTTLIDGILNYSKNSTLLANGKEETNLQQLLHEIFSVLDPLHKVDYTESIDTPSIYTHKIALQQVLSNLISNALKYNDKEITKISITSTQDKQTHHIDISDNGPGIRPEDQTRIFQLYETTANRDRTGNRGTGIGLATVLYLLEAMNGSIAIKSELGIGTSFRLSIPV